MRLIEEEIFVNHGFRMPCGMFTTQYKMICHAQIMQLKGDIIILTKYRLLYVNFWKFLTVIKKEEDLSRVKFVHLQQDRAPPNPHRVHAAAVNVNARIGNVVASYANRQHMDYIRGIVWEWKTFRRIFSIFVCASGGGLLSGGLFAQGVNFWGVIVRGVNVQVVNVRGGYCPGG